MFCKIEILLWQVKWRVIHNVVIKKNFYIQVYIVFNYAILLNRANIDVVLLINGVDEGVVDNNDDAIDIVVLVTVVDKGVVKRGDGDDDDDDSDDDQCSLL